MACNCKENVLCFYFLFFVLFLSMPWSDADITLPSLPLKAVNLGNWLVTEGWMKPSLFDGIVNNDLLDGNKVTFKSMKWQKFLSAEDGGGNVVVANRQNPLCMGILYVQGSQNGDPHSGSRDRTQEWGASHIDKTVEVVEFLASRNGEHPNLVAIELMNEPRAPGVTSDDLITYYQKGYETIRNHTSNAYVILSNPLNIAPGDRRKLFSFAAGKDRVIIDVHYYNLYEEKFKGASVEENINFVKERASELKELGSANAPLIFVGEWVGGWYIKRASQEDYRSFARAQLGVYGRASFGWAYWSYRCQYPQWSLQSMIENNIIKLN